MLNAVANVGHLRKTTGADSLFVGNDCHSCKLDQCELCQKVSTFICFNNRTSLCIMYLLSNPVTECPLSFTYTQRLIKYNSFLLCDVTIACITKGHPYIHI